MYEFSDRELRDLIESLPPVLYARMRPIRVTLRGVRSKQLRKRERDETAEAEICLLCGADADLCCDGAPYRRRGRL